MWVGWGRGEESRVRGRPWLLRGQGFGDTEEALTLPACLAGRFFPRMCLLVPSHCAAQLRQEPALFPDSSRIEGEVGDW